MSLKNDDERTNTQVKLERLAARHRALTSETGGDHELREMTLQSLKRSMNELREEIAVYDACRGHAGKAIAS